MKAREQPMAAITQTMRARKMAPHG
eukprot:SAG31_NODE_34218_length_335_cov_0.877119_1_plen_24_part_10